MRCAAAFLVVAVLAGACGNQRQAGSDLPRAQRLPISAWYELVRQPTVQGSRDAPVLVLEVMGLSGISAVSDSELADIASRLPGEVAVVRLRLRLAGDSRKPEQLSGLSCAVAAGISTSYIRDASSARDSEPSAFRSIRTLPAQQAAAFRSCLRREVSNSTVAHETTLLSSWRVMHVPALFVNGIGVPLPISERGLDSVVGATLKRQAPF
jgi:hypothetical protein